MFVIDFELGVKVEDTCKHEEGEDDAEQEDDFEDGDGGIAERHVSGGERPIKAWTVKQYSYEYSCNINKGT